MLESMRNPKFNSYADADIQRMYASLDDKRKACVLLYDQGKATDAELDAIDRALFLLDDELCARGY
jgi:hypothetical protein